MNPAPRPVSGVPDSSWIVPGLIGEHDRILVTGGSNQGKSTLMNHLVGAVQRGRHPFHPERPLPDTAHHRIVSSVLYDPDTRADVAMTLGNLAASLDADPSASAILAVHYQVGNLELEDNTAALLATIDAHQHPRCAVLLEHPCPEDVADMSPTRAHTSVTLTQWADIGLHLVLGPTELWLMAVRTPRWPDRQWPNTLRRLSWPRILEAP